MTEVSFHTGVPDVLGYACRLVRKAVRKGSRVVVCAPIETLRRFDQALWAFDPLDFIAHATLREGQPVDAKLARTPVWLAPPGVTAPSMPLLAFAKRRVGRGLGSAATVKEGAQNLVCAYLSVTLLAGLLANAFAGWWWADPAAALVIAGVAAREGRDTWRGESCCDTC